MNSVSEPELRTSGEDAISVSVMGKRLENITKEMGLVLVRTSSSPLFQARDCVVGISDASARILCQIEYMPLMTYGYVTQLRRLIEFFEDEIYPGDVFTTSDVFYGGNQAQDVATLKPVFVEDELEFWLVAKGHLLDLGGALISGYNPEATEVWQETMRITPVKIVEKGNLRRDVWNLLIQNGRLPEITERDWLAQVGACEIGERNMRSLVSKYGLSKTKALIEALLNASERQMKKEIEKIPDGEYNSQTSWIWTGKDRSIKLRGVLKAKIRRERVFLDFTGTDKQIPYYANGAYSTTLAAALASLFMCVDPDIPHNDGSIRPIEIDVPKGSFLDCTFPSPTVLGNFICNDVVGDLIMKALAPVCPRATAGWMRGYNHVTAGIDPRTGKSTVCLWFTNVKGGAGAGKGVDGGQWGLMTCGGAYSLDDYEIFEHQYPAELISHEFVCDSSGAGQWRGGLAMRLTYRTYHKDPVVISYGENSSYAHGLFSGHAAPPGYIEIVPKNGTRRRMLGNEILLQKEGSIGVFVMMGGGGWGPPYLRDEEAVRQDVINGKVSIKAARDTYGVCLDPVTFEIDSKTTAKLRKSLARRTKARSKVNRISKR